MATTWLNSVLSTAAERHEPHVCIQPSADRQSVRAIALKQENGFSLMEPVPFPESAADLVEPLETRYFAALLIALNARRSPCVALTGGDSGALQEHWIDENDRARDYRVYAYFHRRTDRLGNTQRLIKLSFDYTPQASQAS